MIKLYKLTICYDEEKDEIEFIEETLDNDTDKIVMIGENTLKDFFTEDEILSISQAEFGEA
tara:strand:+ start:1337 stop:1519 length:183 start_codon:yes stop_codon:yes gene_type:complete